MTRTNRQLRLLELCKVYWYTLKSEGIPYTIQKDCNTFAKQVVYVRKGLTGAGMDGTMELQLGERRGCGGREGVLPI